jgi:hypothetical protein
MKHFDEKILSEKIEGLSFWICPNLNKLFYQIFATKISTECVKRNKSQISLKKLNNLRLRV